MKINQTQTAIECYHGLSPQHFTREEEKTLIYLRIPQTISMLVSCTGIEKSSMSRVLNTLLKKKETIIISKIDKCPISKKTVQWYEIKEKQLSLFQ